MPGVFIVETERLRLRRLDLDDAPFIFELVNDPDWIRFIGDKGVRNLDDARHYIETGPMAMYREYGFGLYCVERKSDTRPLGICGLRRRDSLADVDLGFALLPAWRGLGYAGEAAGAVVTTALAGGIEPVCAILKPDNRASRRLLEKLGFERSGGFHDPASGDWLDRYVIDSRHGKVRG